MTVIYPHLRISKLVYIWLRGIQTRARRSSLNHFYLPSRRNYRQGIVLVSNPRSVEGSADALTKVSRFSNLKLNPFERVHGFAAAPKLSRVSLIGSRWNNHGYFRRGFCTVRMRFENATSNRQWDIVGEKTTNLLVKTSRLRVCDAGDLYQKWFQSWLQRRRLNIDRPLRRYANYRMCTGARWTLKIIYTSVTRKIP